jgi:hypothetical protein
MNRFPLLLGLCLLLAIVGCQKSQVVKDSWKFTTRQYRTYLNTPASVDLADKGSCEVYELALGEAVISVDMELQKLIRAMENSDHNPDQRWVMSMMNRFPWLAGVALVDGDGKLVAKYPEASLADFDPAPLLELDPKQRPGALRAFAKPQPGGAEVYVANPVYGDGQMRGLIIAHFDIRSLVTLSPEPGSFVVASPVGVLWPGNFGAEGGEVGSVDWAKLLTEKSCGIIGSEGSGFFWTTRYLGNLALVYAMPSSAGGGVAPAPEAAKAPDEPPASEAEPPAPEGGSTDTPQVTNMPGAEDAAAPPNPPVQDGPPDSATE